MYHFYVSKFIHCNEFNSIMSSPPPHSTAVVVESMYPDPSRVETLN